MSLGRYGSYYGYRLLSRFAEVLPGSWIGPISHGAGRVGARLLRRRRDIVQTHLCRVLGRPPTKDEVRSAFGSYVRYWIDAFRLPVLPKARFLESEVEGRIYLEQAIQRGKGVIVVVPHLGNWDAAGAWCSASGFSVTTVAENVEPPKLRTWFREFRESIGITSIENDRNVAGRLAEVLGRGEVVALVGDRDIEENGLPVSLFGHETTLPAGPAVLGLRTGAAVLPAACVVEKSGRFRLIVRPPLDTARSSARLRDDVQRITESLAAEFEVLIRRDPTQWHVFVPFWLDERSS